MSSTPIDFDDLYEDFISLTSSSSSPVFSQELQYSQLLDFSPDDILSSVEAAGMSNGHGQLNRMANAEPSAQYPWLYHQWNSAEVQEDFQRSAIAQPVNSIACFQYPSGIEVVLKQVPSGCQALLRPSDVPESALHRKYFTVGELLALKRELISRYTGQPVVLPAPDRIKGVAGTRHPLKRNYESEINLQSEKVSVIKRNNSLDNVRGAVKEAMTILEEHHVSSSSGINQ